MQGGMIELGRKNFAYASLGIAVIGLLALISNLSIFLNFLGALLISVGTFSGLLMYKYGYLIIPWITKRGNVVLVTDTGYEIPPSQDVVITKAKEEDLYYASVFLGIKLHKSALEMDEAELMNYNKQFERAMASFKKVVKIAYMMQALDISEQKKELEAKKAEAQLRLQREREKAEPDVLKIERYEREIAYYQAQIDRIVRGVRPMAVVLYAMTTAAGLTKDEAIAKARAQASELKTILENTLNTSVEVLTGDELLKALNWEEALPLTKEDLENMVESESMVGGV